MYEFAHSDKHHSSNSVGRLNTGQWLKILLRLGNKRLNARSTCRRTITETSVPGLPAELHGTESEVLYFASKGSKVELIRRD
ncbi:hypothetical protein E4U60_007890 [Claviceps pazoutovae]|uniref:Uncharacterized protein n=1 Tax=Claviceps pazoutovae TaxID=1649127 RepID=A0A9P7SIH2_9HYPO|nr:hypothetical protein E4U60_007890 [Claviceps pazoutovae]